MALPAPPPPPNLRGARWVPAVAKPRLAAISLRVGLLWRTRRRAVGTEHAAVAGEGLEKLAAVLTLVEAHASVGRHFLDRLVPQIMGTRSAYGQVIKSYSMPVVKEAARRYAPGHVVAVEYRAVVGSPEHISTSYVERSNLSIRMGNRRFTRLTNAYSKKLPNHAASVGLFMAHYNWCRVHETTHTTPAVALGVADHPWSIGELVQTALTEADRPELGARYGRFTVIDGGK